MENRKIKIKDEHDRTLYEAKLEPNSPITAKHVIGRVIAFIVCLIIAVGAGYLLSRIPF